MTACFELFFCHLVETSRVSRGGGTGDYVYMATGRRKDDLRDQMQRAKRSGYTVSLRLVKASDEARLLVDLHANEVLHESARGV